MPTIGGQWVNYYGSVVDHVVSVVGMGSSETYEIESWVQMPPDYQVIEAGPKGGSVSTGETNFHIFSLEVPEIGHTENYIFQALIDGGDTDAALIEPDIPSTVPSAGDVGFTSDPVSGLPTEVGRGESGEVAVQCVRVDNSDYGDTNFNVDTVLTGAEVSWTSNGSTIGEGEIEFEPDWDNNEPHNTVLDHPMDAVTEMTITSPDEVGEHQFCANIDGVYYYTPTDSEWHQPLDYRV